MLHKRLLLLALSLCLLKSQKLNAQKEIETRYILYDVNPGEGFNLRRDVFMRMAVFVHKLNEKGDANYVLVLPPWGRLYHWQSRELGEQVKIPWKSFFDTNSIKRFVPAMELEEFIEREGPVIDSVLYLQHYAEGWTDGKFEEKFDYRDCIEEPRYIKEERSGLYTGWFWGYAKMRSKAFHCLSVQGTTAVISELIRELDAKSVMLNRGENLLHDYFGDENYWSARRSMRFSSPLVEVANAYRTSELGSTDERDKTEPGERWEDFKPERGTAKGGDYLCVHLRRKDYVYSREGHIPSVKGAAEQVERKLDALGLKTVFVSTDAPLKEFEQFKTHLTDATVKKFIPSVQQLREFKDGGVAIIDQIVCSHARYFLGSAESTFTFRIQEEREIMGFPVDSTFGMLCPDGKFNCEKGSIWKIVYPKTDGRIEL